MENLSKLRKEKELTPLSLANKIGVSRELIYKMENNESMGSVDTLVKLANYFDTTTDYLLGRTKINKPINEIEKDIKEDELELLNLYNKLPIKYKDRLLGIAIGYSDIIGG